MKIRRGEVVCDGNIEAIRNLERLLNKSCEMKVLHDASKGKNQLTNDYTPRSLYTRVCQLVIRGKEVKVTFRYDKRDGTARLLATPYHMSLITNNIAGFKTSLWLAAKSIAEIPATETAQGKVQRKPYPEPVARPI